MTKEMVLEAIKGSGGIVSTVSKRLDCAWSTARTHIDKWDETKAAFDDERQAILDMAEGVIYNSIKEGNSQDAKWILATLGKNRGFSEKHEVEHSGATTQQVEIIVKRPHES